MIIPEPFKIIYAFVDRIFRHHVKTIASQIAI